MRIALVGVEPDGLSLSAALVATGRHQLLSATGTDLPVHLGEVKHVADLEEILADPTIDTVLIASRLDQRAAQVRRALQSERLVLCLHPVATRPEGAYEAGMMQQDTRQVLLPVMPDALHPGIVRLHEMLTLPSSTKSLPTTAGQGIVAMRKEQHVQVMENTPTRGSKPSPTKPDPPSILGNLRLVEMEYASKDIVLIASENAACVPGWDILRAIGGEVAEVSALSRGEDLEPDQPTLLAGRFQQDGLFQMTLIPARTSSHFRIRVVGTHGEAELLFPEGRPGPAFLSWREGNESCEQSWDAWNPWPRVVEVLEESIAVHRAGLKEGGSRPPISWQDEIRCLELDDGARRSVDKRRVSQMEYPEASEEVTFKGTMTLVGCALLWSIILLAVLSRWVPWIGWTVGPVLGIFLVLQLLRWIIPPRDEAKETKR